MLTIDGLVVPPTALTIPKAAETAEALANAGCKYASLVECRTQDGRETIVFDAQVERPQFPVHDVRHNERVACRFDTGDTNPPVVLALRADFPMVPHLNMREATFPRSMCLYDRPWEEIRLNWTGGSLIERVRWWLAQTACGALHDDTQSLEPLMFSHGYDLVVRSGFGIDGASTLELVRVALLDGKEGRVFVADDIRNVAERGGIPCLTMYADTPPRPHGVIHRAPKTLADLADLVDIAGFDLLETLRKSFRELPDVIRATAEVRRTLQPLIVVGLPKCRHDGGEVEWIELKGFLCIGSIEEAGVEIGAWELSNDTLGQPLVVDPNRNGAAVGVIVVNVLRRLTWQRATWANGRDERQTQRIVAIGAGAIGSQVALNLARMGCGFWTIVDHDALMPHNLARHALMSDAVIGRNKAMCIATYMNSIADDESIASYLEVDFLHPGERAQDLSERIAEADAILDMSASIPVAREIAARETATRSMSLFLSPSGRDLVLLAEDAERTVRLDELEMVYYRAIATDERLSGHFDSREGSFRYGGSCRDVSSRIPQTHVAVHAGIGASAVRDALEDERAIIRAWRIHDDTMGVTVVDCAPELFQSQTQGNWRVSVADDVLRTVSELREQRLPSETGGILIGSVDHQHRRIYVLLALPSPPDSEEWPTMYIRGVQGLDEARARIVTRTAGQLDYLGEWHSHPPGVDTMPSSDDRIVFGWIGDLLSGDGRPPVMLIGGDGGEARLFVDELDGTVPEALSGEYGMPVGRVAPSRSIDEDMAVLRESQRRI